MELEPQVAPPEQHETSEQHRARRADDPFRAFVEQHQRMLYALAFDLTGNHYDAEDLSQDVFIKAYRSRDGFRREAQTSTWLYRIAVNAYLNKKRKKALRFRLLRNDLDDRHASREAAPRPDVAAEADVIQRHIALALKTLSPKERTAFVLRHYQDLALAEVAGVMGVAEGTVKSLLYRATRKLRKALAFYRKDLGLR